MSASMPYTNENQHSNSASGVSNMNAVLSNSVNSPTEKLQGTGNFLYTHEEVVVMKATEEYDIYLNATGSLSLVEYSVQLPRRVFCIEWSPNDNMQVAVDDQSNWTMTSQSAINNIMCKAKTPWIRQQMQRKYMRIRLEDMAHVEIRALGLMMRLLRKDDHIVKAEFFFQKGNAIMFLNKMMQHHILEGARNVGVVERYSVLTEAQINDRLNGGGESSEDNYELIQSSSSSESVISLVLSPVRKINFSTLPKRQIVMRASALNEAQWLGFHTIDGRISDPTQVKEIIFHGGIEPHLRCDVWKYLLNYYHWNDTIEERQKQVTIKCDMYYSMKTQWQSMTKAQEENFRDYRNRKSLIEYDIKRTDRVLDFLAGDTNQKLQMMHDILFTYLMYNFDFGYVYGMFDLLVPIFAIQNNEVDAFWCFVGFIDLVFFNFDNTQTDTKVLFKLLLEFTNPRLFKYIIADDLESLFFCFRWLLVWYKREFENNDLLKLWECLLTHLPGPNFPIFISLAILDQETDIIIDNKFDCHEIIKHINELFSNIDLEHTLETAEAIYLQVKAAETLPNDIRQILGEPLLKSDDSTCDDFDDDFDSTPPESPLSEHLRCNEPFQDTFITSMFN